MQPRTNGHQKRQSGSGPGPHTDLRQIKQHTSRYRGNETDSYCCGCTKIVLTPQPHVKKHCNNYWNKRTPLILVSTWNTIQQSSWNPQTYSEILRQSEAQTGREYRTRRDIGTCSVIQWRVHISATNTSTCDLQNKLVQPNQTKPN